MKANGSQSAMLLLTNELSDRASAFYRHMGGKKKIVLHNDIKPSLTAELPYLSHLSNPAGVVNDQLRNRSSKAK